MMINILYTHNILRDRHSDFISKYGIKVQHFNILRILKGRYPDVATPGEIKEVMLDKAPDLTRLMDKLEKMDLVERFTCPDNRRKVNIKINPKGINLLNEIMKELSSLERELKSKISSEEADLLSNLLDKLHS